VLGLSHMHQVGRPICINADVCLILYFVRPMKFGINYILSFGQISKIKEMLSFVGRT